MLGFLASMAMTCLCSHWHHSLPTQAWSVQLSSIRHPSARSLLTSQNPLMKTSTSSIKGLALNEINSRLSWNKGKPKSLWDLFSLHFPPPPPSLSFLPTGVFSSLFAAASIMRVQCTIFQRLFAMSPDFQLISVLMKMGDTWCPERFSTMCVEDLRCVHTLCSPLAGFSNGDVFS